MTAEHLNVGLESPVICGLMVEVACQFARARMPAEVVQAIRPGRIIALQKPHGRVRGIVVCTDSDAYPPGQGPSV